MNIDEFSAAAELLDVNETQRALLIAYYQNQTEGIKEFALLDLKPIYHSLDLPMPNWTRLGRNAISQKFFLRGSKPHYFRLHAAVKVRLEGRFDGLLAPPHEAKSDSSVIPDSLLLGKRSYVMKFGAQINASYTNGIFDGCAVLMRRLLEVSLIHVYENCGLTTTIETGNGRFKDLNLIVADAKTNAAIKITKDTADCLDIFRELGNLSAHRLYYTCHREEIEKVKHKYRLVIEELFVKAGKCVEK